MGVFSSTTSEADSANVGDSASSATGPVTFNEFYREFAPGLYRFCLSQTGSPDTAEDVAAEVMSRALARFDDLAGAEHARAWLFRAARNLVIDQHRARVRFARLLPRLRGEEGRDVADLAVARDELARATAAIRRLGKRERELVGLRVAGGLSYAEIANVTGIREGVARVAVHRALSAVRATLAETQ